MKRIIRYIFFIAVILTTACQPDTQPPVDPCPNYPDGWDNLFPGAYIYQNYAFRAPCFNPNNPNEFAYIRYAPGAIFNYELRKHNIQTEDDNLIANVNYCGFRMSWSNTDWIIFNQTLYDVWKIKSDGTGLTQLTSAGQNFAPIWNSNGQFFLYYTTTGGFFPIIADANGNIIDTIAINATMYSWSSNDKILNSTTYQSVPVMALYDLSNDSLTPLIGIPYYGIVQWLPDNINFVGRKDSDGMIWKVNTQTGESSLVKGPCGDKYLYSGFSISPDGTKLLVERCEAIMVDSFSYRINNDIVLMNIDGSNEQVITLPQN